MSKLLNIVTLVLVSGVTGIEAPAQGRAGDVIPFSGKIGNKWPIAAELTISDRKVSGRYSHLNKTEWLMLEGTVSAGRITLVEREAPSTTHPEGRISASFDGMLQQDSTVTGMWKSIDGTRVFPWLLMKERFRILPDSVTLKLDGYTACDCYSGTDISLNESRLSPYVHNKLLENINVDYVDCPCEKQDGVARGILEETKRIHYNRNNVLTIVTHTSGVGAYPSEAQNYSSYSLRTGTLITVPAIFRTVAREQARDYLMTELVRQAEAVIRALEQSRIDEDRKNGKLLREITPGLLENVKADPWPREFYISQSAIVFRYELKYPHAVQAIAPGGEVTVQAKDISGLIDPSGPLGFLTGQ